MQYRSDKNGKALSVLGYGCMRFTKNGNKIDIDKAVKEISAAVEAGVNYFDTAYIYPGNETAVGEIFERLGCRERINIATKLPHYMIKSLSGARKLFNEELIRLKTDYIDYYLLHMLTDVDTFTKLKKLGVIDWLEEQKEVGAIRNIGFSYHGSSDMFIKLVDAYDWDFVQIQYNYLDEHSQAGRKGLNHAAMKGIPIIIMEPLRGGRLVNNLPGEAIDIFEQTGQNRSPAEWAFRWLYNQPEVTVVLSGMNSLEMVEENVRVADSARAGEFTQEQLHMFERVAASINSATKVGCTGCGYCMPCPAGVDIPGVFSCYNAYYMEEKSSVRQEYLRCTAMRKTPSSASLCRQCGKCEKHCPQGIAIRNRLKDAESVLEPFTYKAARFFIRLFRLW